MRKTNEKIVALQEQIKALEQERYAEDRANRERWEEAWSKFLASDPYEWLCTPRVEKHWSTGEAREGVSVRRRINPDKFGEWLLEEGLKDLSYMADDKILQWHGMWYFRTDENILTHDGGGYLVLQDPKLCNDEEWLQIVKGNIPAKFKRVR